MTRLAIPEGGKDVDALGKHGFGSVCNPFGAGKWEDRYSKVSKEASTLIVPDNDNAGWAHAEQVASVAMERPAEYEC
jgi:DNA primase